MIDSLTRVFDDAGLMPHGVCFAWRPDLVFAHAGADLLITIAYLVIPLALVKLVRSREDIQYGWVFNIFAAFILLCGLTHAVNIFVLWEPDYVLQALVKIATAIVSVATAVLIWRVLPSLISLPSHNAVMLANERLEAEIRERTEIQEQLAARTKELQRSNEDLESFAYTASHDLRAPLRGVGNLIGWIKEDLGDLVENDVEEKFQLMSDRVRRMERMLEDLLQYSRIGRTEVDAIAFDPETRIRETFDLLNAEGRFELEIPDTLPELVGTPIVFQQVVANVIGNAVKHHDGETGKIRVTASRFKTFDRISIADDGPGIPEQYRDQVFAMFRTLKSRDSVEGSGMGLAIVRRILEVAGGSATIADNPEGRGAVIHIDWPRMDLRANAA